LTTGELCPHVGLPAAGTHPQAAVRVSEDLAAARSVRPELEENQPVQLASHHAGQRRRDHTLGVATGSGSTIALSHRVPGALDFYRTRPVGKLSGVPASGEESGETGRALRPWDQRRRPDDGTEVVVAPP
jgi:hypothetical protein